MSASSQDSGQPPTTFWNPGARLPSSVLWLLVLFLDESSIIDR